MESVTATELARNTREILERVASSGQTVTIERNNSVIAQIGPPQKTMTVKQALAGLFFAPTLSASQGKDWLADSRGDFEESVQNPWE